MLTATTHGAPNWVDLNTPDVDDAVLFYTELFDWATERSDSPMGAYVVARVRDHAVGGMMADADDPSGMPAMWTVFFHVADIHETVNAVEGAGGSVLEGPTAIPDGTLIAVVADPTGAVLACSDGLGESAAWYGQEPGAASWVELLTTDPPTAESFYATVFGWDATTEDTTGGQRYTMFTLGGTPVAGMLPMPTDVPAGQPSHWSVYFATDDCERLVARAAAAGATTIVPPTEVDAGRFAVLADRQGATFDVLEKSA